MTTFFSNSSLLLGCMNWPRQYHSPHLRSVQSSTLSSQGVSRVSLQEVFRVSLCALKECSETYSAHSSSNQSLALRTQGDQSPTLITQGAFKVLLCGLKECSESQPAHSRSVQSHFAYSARSDHSLTCAL
jgi:hypothetical protein